MGLIKRYDKHEGTTYPNNCIVYGNNLEHDGRSNGFHITIRFKFIRFNRIYTDVNTFEECYGLCYPAINLIVRRFLGFGQWLTMFTRLWVPVKL